VAPVRSLGLVRRGLDAVYLACGVFAAGCLLMLLVIIVAQMVARWTGHLFPGATSYAGYAMAAASFLAFAHALSRGAHIRVGILLNFAGRYRRWVELWCFAIGTLLGWFLARYVCNAVYWSWKLGDVSQGQDATPLWIPQLPMAIGAVVFAVALTDHLVRFATGVETATGDIAERLE
jgi:TRAP-type mannitol/chloroaromatic compound transport system permease small subunit